MQQPHTTLFKDETGRSSCNNKTSIKPLTKKQCNQHKNVYKKSSFFVCYGKAKGKEGKPVNEA